ncbi:hypothetical protein A2634_01505 [Candidatus Amesbacteria bacterium RIFCSPHIGHO2_01_FULL_48_32]|uniref:Type II toxin-antitoxin system mRNA interferase toxin, RelE/StbE family n=1 Tax=Candidatus Amesbacteria bacterium RIFCSPLOWO2_01_FULL_48_25 TaxID=1797259 RepID=A0A1F4ZC00_9BACT|nr:MAG: hypothetical protein A2634_01505 [Candidatus Amesbacteria bacterium RIFCSPHIGHO2_01_FULL_48_32]OGD03718.1 MAG: hypothetical protein A2989_03490 [Candidatus Amesbacteria bacterium RIFCSPLOWO2_01_FULL_48_25]HJZ05934.1 type II toxin-antitoxin system mRNA interferase toxin, RelE/StbE family [Patescibacteria group bacterium]
MNIELHPTFKKHYKKRISQNQKLTSKTIERVGLFKQDPKNPLIKDHALTGTHFGHRAFWITGNIRVIYEKLDENTVLFLDIGTHPQVY